MQITVEIPDQIAQRLDKAWGNISRRLLELVIIDAYRCGEISTSEVRQILQLSSRLETHSFLKKWGFTLTTMKLN